MRRFGLILAFAAGIVLLLAGAGWIWLSRAELGPRVAGLATNMLGRQVTLGSLTLQPGFPVIIEIRDLRIANAEWAGAGRDDPEMLRLERLSARLDPAALLGGLLHYEKLETAGLRVRLERSAERVGNWEFPGLAGSEETPDGGFALVPANRTQFPVLNDFSLRDALITYRTTSGNELRIGLREAVIGARDRAAPVRLQVDGDYNGAALRLQGRTASFAVLRDRSRPFEAAFSVEGDRLRADFGGLIDKPLDFDAVQGRLSLEADWLSALLRLFGDAETRAALPFKVQGGFSRAGDQWQLEDAFGQLAGQDFAGRLALTEGPAGGSDRIEAALEMPSLDLDPLLAGLGDGSDKPMSLQLDTSPAGNRITATLNTAQLRYRDWHAADVSAQARSAPGVLEVTRLRFALGGGQGEGSLTAQARARATHVAADVSLARADAARLAALFGAGQGTIAGRVAVRAFLEMTGPTLAEALQVSRGHLVASMEDGRIARSLLEQASTDLRALFRNRKGEAELDCLLGVATLQNAEVAVTPLRLRAETTQLRGGGMIDLAQRRIDLVLRSDPGASGFFALDIPLRFTGPFGDIGVAPTRTRAELSKLDSDVAIQALPPALKQLATANACAGQR